MALGYAHAWFYPFHPFWRTRLVRKAPMRLRVGYQRLKLGEPPMVQCRLSPPLYHRHLVYTCPYRSAFAVPKAVAPLFQTPCGWHPPVEWLMAACHPFPPQVCRVPAQGLAPTQLCLCLPQGGSVEARDRNLHVSDRTII